MCKQNIAIENFEVRAQIELLQYMKEEIAEVRRIVSLQDLTDMMTIQLQQHGIQKVVNCTRLKKTVLQHFPNMTAEKGIRNRVFIVCSKTARKMISDATQTPDEESRTLLMVASILRKAVFHNNNTFCFDGSFPYKCQESSVPQRMKYFFSQLLIEPKSSPEQEN